LKGFNCDAHPIISERQVMYEYRIVQMKLFDFSVSYHLPPKLMMNLQKRSQKKLFRTVGRAFLKTCLKYHFNLQIIKRLNGVMV